MVSQNILPNLTKQQEQFKKKLNDEIKEKNSKAGHLVHLMPHSYQTLEGYISTDIYILSYIQNAPKRIFHIFFWSRIF
jgi:hypothetical protein